MKTIIQGKEITTTYDVDYKWKQIRNDKNETVTVYTGKPELKKEETIKWKKIYEVNEIVEFNQKSKTRILDMVFSARGFESHQYVGTINLTETEEVNIVEKLYIADINASVLRVDKIMKEEELNKEGAEDTLKSQVAAFNKMMIESEEKLLSYCNVHKLDPSKTDVDELFKLVYPNKKYKINDGKLVPIETSIPGNDVNLRQYTYGIPSYGTGTTIASAKWID